MWHLWVLFGDIKVFAFPCSAACSINACDLTFDNSNLLNLHTLTHAAEDVGFDEVYKFAYKVNENGEFPKIKKK
jgi:hypothetical protein